MIGKLDYEGTMKQWDRYREMIANGFKGSLPRDWFEMILCHILELEEELEAKG